MNDVLFLSVMTCALILLLSWAFKRLPEERWQMLAVVPVRKNGDFWQGLNLTYYGFFLATSQTLSILLLLVLLGAARISPPGTALSAGLVLSICVPASRIVAILVEKKRHSFTIGGASFVGIVIAPWCILLAERVMRLFDDGNLPMLPIMAAIAVSYSLGEGLGRLGCISFGCCYGKSLADCSPFMRRIFAPVAFVFQGPTKKAIYEGNLTDTPLVPIQAVTCILYCLTAIVGSFLFLHGKFTAALLLGVGVTQIWRILSETLRADFRGFSRISAYQKMSALAVAYVVSLTFFIKAPQLAAPAVGLGIATVWTPSVILGLQMFWLFSFAVYGRSTVTASTLSFRLIREHV